MRSLTTKKILNLILEITHLLTGENSTLVKKTFGKCVTLSTRPPVSAERKKIQKSITKEDPFHLSLNEANNAQKILDLTNKITELLTGEVPIRCQDVTIHFSMEEWDYVEGHKDLYKDVMMVDRVPHGLQVDKDRTRLTKHMLNLILDFFAQLTGEQYLILENDSKSLRSSIHDQISGKKLRSIAKPELHSLLHDKNSDEKILDLTNKITELLTGEVPIRCEDIAVYFSMEEWDYVEGHKDLYKDAMMEDLQPLTSPEKNCPKYAKSENPQRTNVKETKFSCLICGKSFKHNSKLLRHQMIHTGRKPYMCSECPKSFICKADLTRHQKVHTGEKPFTCPECGKSFSEEWNLNKHQKNHVTEKLFKCSRCNKCFATNIALHNHQKIHSKDCLLSCSECGKTFVDKSNLLRHHKVHTGEKPYLCLECGKSFAHKYHLGRHLKTCSECNKNFCRKRDLTRHHKVHTRVQSYSCLDCRKTFCTKIELAKHHRVHTGERPYSRSECEKCFGT